MADSNIRQEFVSAYDAKHAIEMRATARRRSSSATTTGLSRFRSSTKQAMAVRHQGRARRDLAPPHRPQRALRHPSEPRLCPGAERICLARSGGLGPRCLCAEDRKPVPERRTDFIGRPPRERSRARLAISLRRLQPKATRPAEADPLSWLLLPYPHTPGRGRSRRRLRLSRQGQDDRRLCAARLPAEYGNSGIMTFMVNQDGTVFQKDLGDRTEKIARKIETFDPDLTGRRSTPSLAERRAVTYHRLNLCGKRCRKAAYSR